MKKGAKSIFFARYKKNLILAGILAIVIIVGIIFMQLKDIDENDSNTLNIQNKTNSPIPETGGNIENDGGVGQGQTGGTEGGGEVSGGVSSGGTGGVSSETPGIMPDSIFPIYNIRSDSLSEVRQEEVFINFRYQSQDYALTVLVNRQTSTYNYMKTTLKSGERVISKISHEYGEDEDNVLEKGNVVFFDTNNDGVVDIQSKLFVYYNRTIIVSNTSLEICRDGIDNDGDGLTDCQEKECFAAVGLDDDFDSARTGLEYGRCWENEASCMDNLDNNGNGLKDVDERECVNDECDFYNRSRMVRWSYMPEEDLTGTPARRGCCLWAYCVNASGACIQKDSYYETAAGNSYYICGDNNNWDRCGPVDGGSSVNKYPEDLSDGGNCVCKKISANKYGWACT